MKIKILGTSGTGGWPSMFCTGFASQRALELGGKNIRSRSSILIDDILKIDFPPDSFYQAVQHGFNFSHVKYLFITRSSYNNLAVEEFQNLSPFLSSRKHVDDMRIFGNQESIGKLKTLQPDLHASLHEIEPYQTLQIGSFVVSPLKARNNGDMYPLNYIIRKNHRAFLYATDTGFYDEKTWEFLRGKTMDLILLECTQGPKKSVFTEKMGLPDVLNFKKRAEEMGLANANTRWLLTHFSHQHGLLHEEMEEIASPFGFDISFDGMEIDMSM